MVKDFICVDLETTGLSAAKDCIIEIGAVKYRDGKPVETFSELIKPNISIPARITELTGISDADVADSPTETVQMKKFLEFASEDSVFMGHNLGFDYSFLTMAAARLGTGLEKMGIDTLDIAKKCTDLPSKTLENLCLHYGIVNRSAHRAYCDAEVTAKLYFSLFEEYGEAYPAAFSPKELTYKIKKTEPATERQKKYLKDLLEYHKISADINYGTLTKSEASRRIDNIIFEHGKPRY